MPRFLRILSVSNSSTVTSAVAEPPASVKVESEFVAMLAGLLCIIMCMVGLVAVAHCRCLRRRANGGPARTPSQPNKGIKKKSLDLLPKFSYSTTEESSKEFASTECAICLAEFVDGEQIRVLPHCGHGFHVVCIDTWLGSRSSCPSCRQTLVVAMCRKCGRSPALSSSPNTCGGGGAASPSVELKSSGDAATVATFLP